MTRSPAQVRAEASWHEAGHAIAAFELGRLIERVEVRSLEELAVEDHGDVDFVGQVTLEPHALKSIGAGVDECTIYFAGQAAAKIAWASGIVSDADFGIRRVTIEELTDEALTAVPNGRTPAARAVSLSWSVMPAEGDQAAARAIADMFTLDGLEREALLSFCQIRASNLIQTERSQRLIGRFANALEEHGLLEGEHLYGLLNRWAALEPGEV